MFRKVCSLLLVTVMLGGCMPKLPADALQMKPDALADRQMQTRRFETTNNMTMLSAASGVLQDLGFTLEESEVPLGVLVASKERDATSGAQVFGAILLAALAGVPQAIDDTQTIRASLIMRHIADSKDEDKEQKLTLKEIARIQGEIEDAIASGLVKHYPKDIRAKVAKQIAKNTADSLTHNLSTLASVHMTGGESTVRVTFQRVIVNTQGQITRAEQVNDPEIYREFFERLSKSVFLEAHQI